MKKKDTIKTNKVMSPIKRVIKNKDIERWETWKKNHQDIPQRA